MSEVSVTFEPQRIFDETLSIRLTHLIYMTPMICLIFGTSVYHDGGHSAQILNRLQIYS